MNITTDELYQAFRVAYKSMQNNPDDHATLDETFEDIDASAMAQTQEFAGIIKALRQTY